MTTPAQHRVEQLYRKKVANRIAEISERFIHTHHTPIADAAIAETMDHLTYSEAKRLPYQPIADITAWGKNWGTAWFRLRIKVPKAMRGHAVRLLFDLENSECLIYRDGMPVQGLCWSRKEYLLLEKAKGGERIELYVEAGANARLGAFEVRTMHPPEIAIFNRAVWDAYWDLAGLYDIIDTEQYYDWLGKPFQRPTENDPLHAQYLYALNEAVDLFDYGDPDEEALAEQAQQVRNRLKKIYACPANASAPTFAVMGHAHIDVAWKWPLRETVRKCGRSFSNVLDLMEEYPDFLFAQSQPHLYEFTKERYPKLYKKIRQRVKEGRWLPTGCMWVEPDCNITGGESLVRQILFGTRFFKEEFGCDVKTLWLPDVFGYSAALPQLLKRSGIPYFFTAKMALNQFEPFPHHSFHWEGLDGSEVLAHFEPTEEYSSELEPWLIRMGAHEYAQKDRSPIQILPFGHGDGGGGPARKHVERLQRYRDFEGMPKLESMSPVRFFERLESESTNLPRWVGELYLENHRGCYTTQARTKQLNRQAEYALRDAELLGALLLPRHGKAGQKTINAAWKKVLLNQFHDILPGSSIDEVHVESEAQYGAAIDTAHQQRDKALTALARKVDTRGDGIPVLVMNTLGWDRSDTITLDAPKLKKNKSYVAVAEGDKTVPMQIGADGKARFRGTLPAVGHKVFHIQKGEGEASPLPITKRSIENDQIRLRFDIQGRLKGIYDKVAKREVLAPKSTANQFILFEDKMASTGTAWDVDVFYNDKPLEKDGTLLSMEIVEAGPVRSVLRQRRSISKSTISQDIILTAGSARIDFETTVEWGDEKDVFLKVAFPVRVRSEKARYEIQFGSLERPTHWNTPQDLARFEVPAQKWADLSEGNYGVALLNDCKYGYDIKGNIMRLSLLRAPKDPGKHADVNQTHYFTYALWPHEGDFTGGLVREGYALNVPILAETVNASKGSLPPTQSLLSVSGENVIIDTVKKAEDEDAIIVRLYEAHGWHSTNTLKVTLPLAEGIETDLMEREERSLKHRHGAIRLDFSPFQIRTLKLIMHKESQ